MVMRWRCISILHAVACVTALSQVGVWHNYTSMKDVRGVARVGDTYWAATSGGLFSWNPARNEFHLFTNAEGLQSVDLTAIGIDSQGRVWTGTSTGIIHILTPETGSWRYITDIATANQTNKRINGLAMYGDTAFICTDFGLSFFNVKKFEFGDTFSRFGTIPSNVRIAVYSAAIVDGALWASISAGPSANYLAVGSLSNPNLLPPEAWTLSNAGGPSNATRNLVAFNAHLYAGTSTGLYTLAGNSWTAVGNTAGKNVSGASASATSLTFCTSAGEVFLVDAQSTVQQYGARTPYIPTCVDVSTGNQPVVGTTGGGLLTFGTSWAGHVPNGPNSNQFISVAIDPRGTVWAASGRDNGQGFYRYRQGEWKSFTNAANGLPTNEYYRASAACNGSVWMSSWGRGAVEIPSDQDTVLPGGIYGTNIGMVGIPSDTSYIVVSSVECDQQGRSWLNVLDAADRNIMITKGTDGRWTKFPVLYGGIRLTQLQERDVDKCMAVDAFGSVWAVVKDPSIHGLISLGNRNTIDSTVAYFLTSADGLPSNEMRTIVVDRDNDIWVGTDRGIGIILNPDRPKSDGGIARYTPLNGVVINTIAVDALNQKWVGTPEGVVLLSPDGTQPLATYTVSSTSGKLIDNDVKSIAIDHATGTVYFATVNGLASLTTAAVAPREAFDGLKVYPNPFRLPSASPLTVDGLVEQSRLKVLSIDGHLVRQLDSPGGRIGFWDGKDEEGRYVASGIYIIVAFTEEHDEVGKGKVAVIRQ